MPFEVYPTTAENIIGATDAALQKTNGVDENLVAQFLDIPTDSAGNALGMACQLGLVSQSRVNEFVASHPYAAYLVTSNLKGKAAILRLVLEQYQPYKTFKHRLSITGSAPEAANQIKAIHGITLHREDILNTFISLGTYTNSLLSEGAGLYKVVMDEPVTYLAIAGEVIQARETAELQVRRQLGQEAADWIDQGEVLPALVTAYQRAALANQDSRAPIVHAGNAIESFLVQLARHHTVNIQNATGINAKADTLARNHVLTNKHLNMLKYLGHVRNAADHGTDPDPDVGHTWDISYTTAIEYVHIAQSVIKAVVAHLHGRFVV